MARLHANATKTNAPVSLVDQDIDRFVTACHGDYDEALSSDGRWPVFYHLSDMRTGLFGWYDIPKDADVLEIGAGFGALTGQLADMAGHVEAWERSLFHARTIAKRWRESENLDIYAGTPPDAILHRKFDIITLVDVLPAIAKGSDKPEPYVDYLKMLQRKLKLHGRLLIAMDNRMGMKFFCGACDPYSKEPFGELSGAFGRGRLFTRREIKEILKRAGFEHIKFYYPLPDYRLPQMIFTDAHLPDENIGGEIIFYDPTAGTRVLPETNLFRDAVKNGLFPETANSFFIECCMQEDFCKVEYASLAADRAPKYNIATCVMSTGDVEKRPFVAAGSEGLSELSGNMKALKERGLDVVPCRSEGRKAIMPRMNYPTFAGWLGKRQKGDKEKVMAAFDRLWAAILQSSPPASDVDNRMRDADPSADWGVILRRVYVNMVPENIFYDDGRLIFFNQMLSRENFPAKYQMFLAVYESADELSRIMPLNDVKKHFGLTKLWDIMLDEQRRFVAAQRRYDAYKYFYEWAEMKPGRMLRNRQILKIIDGD